MASSSNRLIGIEFANTTAVIGCVIYIFLFTIGDKVKSLLTHEEFSVLMDFFPAFLLFLNGTTVSLSLRDKRISRRKLLAHLGKRGSVLFLLGLALCVVWPMNIFIVVGLMYFFSQFVALWGGALLRVMLVVMIGVSIMLLIADVPTTVEYVQPTMRGGNMNNFSGFLFFNGYFSVFPWSIFFIVGILFGRSKVSSNGLLPPTSLLGIGLVVGAIVLQQYSGPLKAQFDAIDFVNESLFMRLRIFYLPFILYGIGTSMIITNLFLRIFKNVSNQMITKFVQTISSMKYSVLLFHILIGLITMGVSNTPNFTNKIVLAVYVILATMLTLYLAVLWKKRVNTQGPVEWLIKRISGSTKSLR